MNKTAIIAASIAAVMAGTAVADTTVYGRARMALQLQDDNNGLVNNSSRIGFKGSEDLGNGMSAIYHYEFGYDADDNAGTALDNRIGVVGVKGDFGTVALGRMWVPTYNLVRGSIDYFNAPGLDSGYVQGSRASDAIAYVNKFGNVDVQAAIVSAEGTDDIKDAHDIAVRLPIGPVTLGLGINEDTAGESGTSIAVGYKGDGFSANLVMVNAEDLGGDNTMSLGGKFGVGNGNIVGRFTNFDLADDSRVTLGYHHNLSKRTQAYVENQNDGAGGADASWIGLKHNF